MLLLSVDIFSLRYLLGSQKSVCGKIVASLQALDPALTFSFRLYGEMMTGIVLYRLDPHHKTPSIVETSFVATLSDYIMGTHSKAPAVRDGIFCYRN